MSEKINVEDKSDKFVQIEQMIDILFSDINAPADELGPIREWLIKDEDQDLKNEVMRQKFTDYYKFSYNPRLAIDTWGKLAKRLNLDPRLADKSVNELFVKKSIWRRISIRRSIFIKVAAIVLPIIMIGAAASLFFFNSVKTNYTSSDIITVSVPPDSLRTITLPDGSRVDIKSNSVISYFPDFTKERKLTLNGEAFFSVVSDVLRPFTVQSKLLTVSVSGTEFNVVSYDDGQRHEVALVSGKLSVRTGDNKVVLEPNQCLKLNADDLTTEVEYFGVGKQLRLLKEPISFKDAPLRDVLNVMEEYFDVSISFAGELDLAESIFLTFNDDLSLDEALFIVQMTYPKFNYSINGNQVIIESK